MTTPTTKIRIEPMTQALIEAGPNVTVVLPVVCP
jgi:hypothetical protein